MEPVYAKSFGVCEEQVHVTGMPRIDLLLDDSLQKKNKEEFYKKYPMCVGKNFVCMLLHFVAIL